MVYCETGEVLVLEESVEMEGGNRRLGVDRCRWWD